MQSHVNVCSRTFFVALLLMFAAVSLAARKAKTTSTTKKVFEHPLIGNLQASSFATEVLGPSVPVLLLLFPSAADSAQTIFDVAVELADAFSPFVDFKFSDLSTDDGRLIAQQFGLESQLALLLFNPEMQPVQGSDVIGNHLTKMPIPYQGELSTPIIAKWILSTIGTSHLERVRDEHDMADFLAKYSSLDVPKFALVSREPSVSPLFLYCSHKYRYAGAFGVIDANNATDVLRRYHVESVPAVMVFVPRRDQRDDVYFMPNASAASSQEDLERFVAQHALPITSQHDMRKQQIIAEEQKLRTKEEEHAKYSNLLRPVVISSQKQWVQSCLSLKKGNCLVVFLESTDSSASIPLEMLANTTRKVALRSQVPLQIAIIDGTINFKMMNFFGVNNGMPDAVFLQPQKKLAVNLVGSFSERGLSSFVVDKALKNIGSRAFKAKQVPKFQKTAPAAAAAENDEDNSADL